MALLGNPNNLDPTATVLRKNPLKVQGGQMAKYEASYLRFFYKVLPHLQDFQ
jgi:hypothetical protein